MNEVMTVNRSIGEERRKYDTTTNESNLDWRKEDSKNNNDGKLYQNDDQLYQNEGKLYQSDDKLYQNDAKHKTAIRCSSPSRIRIHAQPN